MTERWLPVVGADRYEVSDAGRVRSWYSRQGRRRTPHYMSLKTSSVVGYPQVNIIFDNGRKAQKKVHTLVCESFRGPRPEGMEVRHLNGKRDDNRLENLVYGTPKENQADKRSHGTQPLGQTHPNSKLSYIKAEAVRELYATGRFGYSNLAEVFEVGSGTIRKILDGQTWRDEDAPERQPV